MIPQLNLNTRHKLALRLLALASAGVVLAGALNPHHACAQAAPAVAAQAGATKLFPDSRMVVRDRISVEVVGRGPDVVLIPGLSSSRETWRRTAERLRDRYRLHLVNVAGFAGEPPRANATGPVFDPVLEDVVGYIAAAHLSRPIVMGHSLGGTMAVALAERHPDVPGKILVVDSLGFYGTLMGGPTATPDTVRPMVEAMRKGGARPMPEAQARGMASQMVTAPADVDRVVGWMAASDPAVTVSAMTDDMLVDLRPDLAKVTVPVTVLYETPLKPMIERDFAPLKQKRLVEVPNAKHFIMFDQPTAFDAEVDAFLAG